MLILHIGLVAIISSLAAQAHLAEHGPSRWLSSHWHTLHQDVDQFDSVRDWAAINRPGRYATPHPRIQHPEAREKTLLPLTFSPLPLGSVKPRGWLRDQLQLMADGLPGHLAEFYRYVNGSAWLGGHQEYSPLNEGFPYWFNGIVPLAYALDDERLKDQALAAAQYVLGHQHDDGWLGPETDVKRRNLWARMPLFLGLAQLAEAVQQGSSLEIGPVVPAMWRFVDLMHAMLRNNHQGFVWKEGDEFDEQWGRSRAADMVVALQWMYENHPGNHTQQKKIHEVMMLLYEKAHDWSYWFSKEVYIKKDMDLVDPKVIQPLFPFIHGVNAGQGLKYGAVMWRLVHDDRLLKTARDGVRWTFKYHASASGGILADEREAGLSPTRGTELCSVVETMFSLSYLHQALGDRDFAEKCERAAFNALPVMVMPRWWAHQYVAQPNQPVSHRLAEVPFWNVRGLGQTFGMEPNYPCCTVDFSQGLPKFLSASFVRDGRDGIAHALLGPSMVSASTESGVNVAIKCSTNYPFNHHLEYEITADGPFRFSFRVPSWAVLGETELYMDEAGPLSVYPDEHTGMHSILVSHGTHKLTVQIGAQIRVEERANNTVAIYHGALLYAVQVYGHYMSSRPAGYPGTTAPREANDWTITPTSPWNLAIDTSTLRFFAFENRDADNMPNPIWEEDAPPTMISALACEIDWQMTNGGYAPNPPPVGGRNCTSRAFVIGLRPYGSAKLHMAELPTVDLSWGSSDLKAQDTSDLSRSESEAQRRSRRREWL